MDRDDIEKLTVDGLKVKLGELNLSRSGNKVELQARLLGHFGYISAPEDNESDYGEATSIIAQAPNLFTLRDIQDSVSSFSGDQLPNIDQWLREFEDCACTVGWDDLRKFIYGKQLLTGAAKIFIRSQPSVRNWSTLRGSLKREFGVKISSVEVHRQLSNRKKRINESLREYLYCLMEIGQPIKIDDESLVTYFVEGIPDSKLNKSILYQATTLEDLKTKIKIYEKMQGTEGPSSSKVSQPTKNDNNFSKKTVRCFKCGEKGHLSNQCKVPQIKCFKCKGSGHKSFECKANINKVKVEKSVPEREENVNTVSEGIRQTSHRIFKDVEILGNTFSAMIDTGSDVSLMRRDVLDVLGSQNVDNEVKYLNGIGGGTVCTLGSLRTNAKVDDNEIQIKFHIIDKTDIIYPLVIGNDILDQVDMIIDSKGIKFLSRNNVTPDENSFSENTVLYPGDSNPISELEKEFADILNLAIAQDFCEDDLKTGHLDERNRIRIGQMVSSYNPVRPLSHPVEMKIILTDDIPVAQRPRRMSYPDQCAVDEQVDEWLREGIIRKSCSGYSAPVVLVKKKDGTRRLCCDYRKLNEKIVRDNFPMAVIDDVIQRLLGAQIYTTLDLKNGFFHVPVEQESRKYTAFVTHNGQYEFGYVPFGISNSPAVFCRYIASIFRELVAEGTLVIYMDDIVIPAKDETEGIHRLEKVLKVAESNGLKIKWKKCQFLQKKINFLGYVIENSTILPSVEKTKAVANYPLPPTKKALERFLGLTSYFRRFIEGYATIARPLTDLLRKDNKFKMGDEEILAFTQLRNSLVSAPVLKIFDPKCVTEIHADASMYGYGAALLQKDDDQEFHPIEYMSRRTTPAEEKYHSFELEVLAVVEALRKWRIYVLGLHVKIVTDCNAFALTMRKQDVPPRISRWALFLQDFDYTIEHRFGTRMRHVDALSRLSCLMIEDSLKHRIREAQLQDEWVRAVRKVLEDSTYDDFYIQHDILHKDPVRELIVIPSSVENEIITVAHRQGHFAARKTQDLVSRNYFIPNLTKKTEAIVKSCVECIVADAKRGRKEGFLNPIDKADRPLMTYHLDHVGPMEATHKKYNHILVVVDAFTKFVWLYPTKNTGTNEVIDRLTKQATIFGNPQRVITDRGTAFTSGQFREYCEAQGIQHLLIATGVPRGNGQVERIHRIVVPMLAKLCMESPGNWYKHVDRVQRTLNDTPPRSTHISPFRLLTGVDMRTGDCTDKKGILEELAIEEFNKERYSLREEARDNISKIQQENRKDYNRKRVPETPYDIDELVAIKRTQFGTGMKLRPKFLGPYKVVQKLNHGRYVVEKVGGNEGSKRCTTVAEYMKPWSVHSRTNANQDGRM